MGRRGRSAAGGVAVAAALLLLAPVSTAAETWGLFVGVAHYKARTLDDLTYCGEDARALARALERTAGLGPGRRVVLVDRKATRRAILEALDSLVARAGPDDLLVVYFSGHGFQDESRGSGEADGMDEYLAPHDSLSKGVERDISDDLLADRLAGARGRLLLVVDACHAGGLRADLARLPRLTGLLACGEGEESEEEPRTRLSLFTRVLLDGLGGAADADRDGRVTAGEIAGHLRRSRALREAGQTPVLVVPEPGLVLSVPGAEGDDLP